MGREQRGLWCPTLCTRGPVSLGISPAHPLRSNVVVIVIIAALNLENRFFHSIAIRNVANLMGHLGRAQILSCLFWKDRQALKTVRLEEVVSEVVG